MEVGQLTVQFGVVQELWRRDSVRAQVMGKMFGLEAQARSQQRAYRAASESARPAIPRPHRNAHFAPLRSRRSACVLEVADIERRLADVRAKRRAGATGERSLSSLP